MISTYTSDKNIIAISLSIINFCFSIMICTWRRIYDTLAAGLVNPLLLMIVYALSVSVALIDITIFIDKYILL